MSRVVLHRFLLLWAFPLLMPVAYAAATEPSEADLLAGADARIEKHRKAEATITVVGSSGKPVANAEIDVQQTRHTFLFGSNILLWGTLPDERTEGLYRRRFAELLNYATLGFYWRAYEPRQGQCQHEHAEEVARWCQQQGIQTKGHPLAYNGCSDAAWYPDRPETLYRLQLGRIEDCVGRFDGLIHRWDVVNEVTSFQEPDRLRNAPKHTAMWRQVGQMAFTRECFLEARRANPAATLLINDALKLAYEQAGGQLAQLPYERVIEQLVDAKGNRLYDVIGIQSHMHDGIWSTRQIWDVCQRFARFGVPLHFTEVTIVSGDRAKGDWPSTPAGEASQAREVVRFYTLLFSHPAVRAITWWDLADYRAWLSAPAGLLRKDLTPKPAYRELIRLIHGKWWTSARLKTGGNGMAAFRGFVGNYRITVRAAEKPPVVMELSLNAGQANCVAVTTPD